MAWKPTENMLTILAVMPDDGSPISQTQIYRTVGYAAGVGTVLHAMERRGLIEPVPAEFSQSVWRKVVGQTG